MKNTSIDNNAPSNTSKVYTTEFIKYLLVGGMNVVVTGLIYAIGLYLVNIHYMLALILAFLCGTVFTYVLNFKIVFRPQAEFTFRKRFLKYLSSNIGAFLINLAALYVFVDIYGQDPFISQAILMIVVVIANFFSAKHWSLGRK